MVVGKEAVCLFRKHNAGNIIREVPFCNKRDAQAFLFRHCYTKYGERNALWSDGIEKAPKEVIPVAEIDDHICAKYQTSPSSNFIAVSLQLKTKYQDDLVWVDPCKLAEELKSRAGTYEQKDHQVHQALLNFQSGRLSKSPTYYSSPAKWNGLRLNQHHCMITFIPLSLERASAERYSKESVHSAIQKVLREVAFIVLSPQFRGAPNSELKDPFPKAGCHKRDLCDFIKGAKVVVHETHSLADDFFSREAGIIIAKLGCYPTVDPGMAVLDPTDEPLK